MNSPQSAGVDTRALSDRTFGRICQVMYDSVGMSLNA